MIDNEEAQNILAEVDFKLNIESLAITGTDQVIDELYLKDIAPLIKKSAFLANKEKELNVLVSDQELTLAEYIQFRDMINKLSSNKEKTW
jgi:hypothetical protein